MIRRQLPIIALAVIFLTFAPVHYLIRYLRGFFQRLGHVLHALGILVDVVLHYCWTAPLYLIGGEKWAGRPNGHQMISCYVGRAAFNGHRWARIAARVIDAVMGKRHCLLMAAKYSGFAD